MGSNVNPVATEGEQSRRHPREDTTEVDDNVNGRV